MYFEADLLDSPEDADLSPESSYQFSSLLSSSQECLFGRFLYFS